MSQEADLLFEEALLHSGQEKSKPVTGVQTPLAGAQAPSEADALFEEAAAASVPALPEVRPPPPGTIRKEETDAIAEKYKVDPQALYEMSAYLGNQPEKPLEEPAQAAREVAGFLGRAFALNIPQFLLKKAQDENMRQALDEVATIAEERKPTADVIAETAGAVTGAVGLAKGAAKLAGKVFGTAAPAATKATQAYEAGSAVAGGAAQGAATSKEGEELESAAKGAALGGALYGAAKGVGMLLAPPAVRDAAADAITGKAAKRAADAAEASPETLFEAAEQEARIFAKAEADAAKEGVLDMALAIPGAADDVQPTVLQKALQLDEVPDDAAVLTRQLLGDEGIARVAAKEEARLAQSMSEALAELPADKALRESTLASTALEQELKATARLIADTSPNAERFRGTAADALRLIQKTAVIEGNEYTAGIARRAKILQAAERHATSEAFEDALMANRREGMPNPLMRVFDAVQDARFVVRDFDRKLGTNLERNLDDFATQNNYYTRHVASIGPELKTLAADTRAAGIADEALYQALDTGASFDTPEANALLARWKNFYEAVRQDAVSLGVNVAKRDNYVPHKVMPVRDLLSKFEAAVEKVKAETGVDLQTYTQAQYAAIQDNPTFREIKDSLEYLTGDKLTNPADFKATLGDALSPSRSLSRLRTQASSALERVEDEVPGLIRETRMAHLANNWVANTLKHAYFRNVIEDIRLTRDVAAEAGDKRASTYVQALLQDIVGAPRKDTIANTLREASLKAQVALEKVARNSKDPLTQEGAAFLAKIPDAMSYLSQQVYPNFLGLNIRAVLQNLTQPLLTTIPELGYTYGASRMTAAASQLAKDFSKGREIIVSSRDQARFLTGELGRPVALGEKVTVNSPALFLEATGNLGRQWDNSMREAMLEGVRDGVVGRNLRSAITQFGNASMFLYEKAERGNRMLVSYMGEAVAKDLMVKGSSEGAEEFLQKMGDSYRRAITKARDAGDAKETERLVRDYLIGKTVFNYSRASLSGFGRYMGGVFSVFSKWPTTIAGDIVDTFKREGAGEGSATLGMKYIAPLAFLMTVDKMMAEEGENPFYQAFAGRKGLAGWAPIKSISSLTEGNLMQPPVVQALADGLAAVVAGDEKAAVKWLDNTVRSFAPGMGLLRFLATDVRALQGEMPSKPDIASQIEAVTE